MQYHRNVHHIKGTLQRIKHPVNINRKKIKISQEGLD